MSEQTQNKPVKDGPFDAYYRDRPDLRFAILTPEDEFRLFKQMKDGGPEGEEARRFLIENHLLFAAQEARKRARGKLPDEDVISAANIALMTAIDLFNPAKGARFTTYLRFYIKGEIRKLWTQRDPVNYHGKYPKSDETEEGYRKPLEDAVETPDFAGDEFKGLALEALEGIRGTLTESENELLDRVYGEQKSFAEIGVQEGVSREAIRTRHNRLMTKLRAAFAKLKGLD